VPGSGGSRDVLHQLAAGSATVDAMLMEVMVSEPRRDTIRKAMAYTRTHSMARKYSI